MQDRPVETEVEWLPSEADFPDADEVFRSFTRIRRWAMATRRRRVLLPLLLVAGLVTASAIAIHSANGPRSQNVTSARPTGVPIPGATDSSAAPVIRRFIMPQLSGLDRNWSLLVEMPNGFVRVAFAQTTTTTTATGPAQLVVAGGQAYLHSTQETLVVGSDGEASRLGGWVADSSLLFPGDDDHALWAMHGNSVGLVQAGSSEPYRSFQLPATISGREAVPLGNGDLAVPGLGGVYEVGASGTLRRLTTGRLIATGESSVLAQQCDASYQCSVVRIGTAPPSPPQLVAGTIAATASSSAVGSISPDGRVVAINQRNAVGDLTLHLLTPTTGHDDDTHVRPPATTSIPNNAAVWSPDGRYLWTITSGGTLVVIDSHTGHLTQESQQLGLQGRLTALAEVVG